MSHSEVSTWGNRPNKSESPFRNGATGFVIDTKRRVVVGKFRGRVTAADIAEYARQLRAHPGFEPTFAEIADMTEVEELDLKADDFLKLADHIDPFAPEAKRAFVARDSVQNHAARMHKALRAQRNIGIFGSLDEAERWINSPAQADSSHRSE